MLALAAAVKSPIITPDVDIVEATSITEFRSIGARFKEVGGLLVSGEDGAKAPTICTSATAEHTLEKIAMFFLFFFLCISVYKV